MNRITAALVAGVAAQVLPSSAAAQHIHGGHGHVSHGYVGHGHVGHGHAYSHNHVGHYHYGHYPYRGYYSYGYPVYSYGSYSYPNYGYTANNVTGIVGAVYSAPAPPVVSATTARLQVHVPDPDAQVWLEGTLTTSRGMTRVYESPPLEAGKSFTYTIRASWPQDGRTVTEERQVEVFAGQTSAVDFLQPPPAEKIPAPMKRGVAPPER